jgi:hypothetical protein
MSSNIALHVGASVWARFQLTAMPFDLQINGELDLSSGIVKL